MRERDDLEVALYKLRGNLEKAIDAAVEALHAVEDDDQRAQLILILDREIMYVSRAFRMGGTQPRPPMGDIIKAIRVGSQSTNGKRVW